ncbi:MAG: diguanylate cyclase [Lysobacter sp.]
MTRDDEAGSDGSRTLPRRSLRREFARLLVLAAILPALIFGAAQIWSQYQHQRAQLGERLANSAITTGASINEFLQTHLSGLAVLADVRADSAPQWGSDLAALQQRYPTLLTLLVTDRQGKVLILHPASRWAPMARRDVSDREYFRVPASTGQPHVSNAFRGRGFGTDPLVAVSVPLRRDGRFDGVLEASIRVDAFTKLRADAFRRHGYEMLLVDRLGQVIHASKGLPYRFLQRVDGMPFVTSRTSSIGAPDGAQRYPDVLADGGAAFVAQSKLQTGWTLYLFAPESMVVGPLRERALIMAIFLVLLVLGAAAASWQQIRLLTQGTGKLLHELQEFALGRAPGNLRAQVIPDELQPLSLAISDLSARLNTAYSELNDALAMQRGLADSLREAVGQREDEIAKRTAELRAAVDELDRLNRTDPLTGCLNLRGLDDAVASLAAASPGPAPSLALLAFDVDHFKAFNDRYGHPAGDGAIKRVVGAARSALRGTGDQVARVGGEEFVVLLPDADRTTALAVAERIRERIRAADIMHADVATGVLTVSIGMAVAGPEESFQAVRERADEALYRAKREGRDRVAG